MSRYARIAFVGATWLFVACAVGQVFLAGLAVFGVPGGDFSAHRTWGYTFSYLLLVMLALALVGRLPRRQIGLSVALIGMFAFQSVFVALRTGYPAVAALHPVNGFMIILVGIVLGREGLRIVRTEPVAVRSAGVRTNREEATRVEALESD